MRRCVLTVAAPTALGVLFAFVPRPVLAAQVGTITVCYACQNTGDAAIDAALAANSDVAYDGILFAFKNTGSLPITGAVLSVGGDASPPDSFALPTIPSGGEFILIPGKMSDGGKHPSGGLFEDTGYTMDTSDGDGGVDDSSVFKFVGNYGGQAVTSTTAGKSTAIAGTFTPGDAGLILPWRDPGGGSTSFIGDGPDGDGGCDNCYYGVVATLNAAVGSGSALQFTTATLPPGTAGVAYSTPITAAGGVPPYTFSATGLPAGLSLSSSGTLTGIVAVPGSYAFTVKVADSGGSSLSAAFTAMFAAAPVTIVTATSLPSGTAGFEYPPQVLAAAGGTGVYAWSVTSGSLPAGMSLTSDGVIGGTPTTPGSARFTVTATDTAGSQGNAAFSLTIRATSTDLLLSAGSVGFTLNMPSTVLPNSQYVAILSTLASQQIAFSVSVSPAAPWLSVTNGPRTPGVVSVGLTSAALALAAGTYKTAVAVTCTSTVCSGNAQSIAVSLQVAAVPPTLQVQTDVLAFGATTANLATLSQNLNIRNSGGGTANVMSIACEAAWCSVGAAPASLAGGAAAAIPITVNPAMAGTGFFRTQVDISTSGGNGAIPVTLFVAAAASLTLGTTGSQFTMQQGAAPGNSKGSVLIGASGATPISWVASVQPGASWLLPGVVSGTSSASQASSATFSIDPAAAAALAAGAYYGRIEVTAQGAANSPQEFVVVLNVTAATTAVKPDPEPPGLVFLTGTGINPPSQSATVYAGSRSSLGFQANASSDTGWLSVSPGTGTVSLASPAVTSLSVNAAALMPGIYRGSVSYAFGSAALRTVNVLLIVANGLAPLSRPGTDFAPHAACTPAMLAPVQTGLVSNFSAPVAWPTPISVRLLNDCGSAVANGQIVATFDNGDAPLPLALVDPAQGLYSATWAPRHSASQITVNATAGAPGFPNATVALTGSVTPNAVPLLTPHGTLHVFDPLVGSSLAPGTIVQIYGQNLAGAAAQPTMLPLPTVFNGVSAIIGGMPAPLFYISSTQVNAQLPFELQSNQQYQVLLQVGGALTTPDTIQLSAVTPGIAAFANGAIIAQHIDGSLVSQTAPARPGEYLVAYLVGLGQVTPAVTDGGASPSATLALPNVPPVLTINGATYPPAFAGLTPGLVGLYQMNFQVPAGLPAGNLMLTVAQSGNSSNLVTIPYQP
jgi:uncharacterized protein (TIGR03437 family)